MGKRAAEGGSSVLHPKGRSRWISVSSGLSPAWSGQRYKVRPCQTKQRQSQQITAKPEVFHRCDKNLCCVAVWNVRTSFSGFHEVKCLPPINKFHLFGGHVEFLSIARVGKNEATPGRAGVGGLTIVSVEQEETQESRVLIP